MPKNFYTLVVSSLLLTTLFGCGVNSPPAHTAAQLMPANPTPATDTELSIARQQLDAEEQVVADIVQRISPAVVLIETNGGLGSGFLIDREGTIITNQHVVGSRRGAQVLVSFTDLFQTVGTIVGADPDSDIAVLRVSELPPNLTPVSLGDSSQVRVGQRTIAIGNPLGQNRTVTTGIVSAIGRTIRDPNSPYQIGGAIQTDAAINPGNSGGPLLNSRGQVIGMNTAIISRSGTSSGIGFAVPVNLVKKVSDALIRTGRYDHPYLGIRSLRNVTTLDAKNNRLPGPGVLIEPSGNDTPVAVAGLRGQAILTKINGINITSSDDLISFLELNTNPGDTITLSLLLSNGRAQELRVKLGARPTINR
jgi:2-alkenal reductase